MAILPAQQASGLLPFYFYVILKNRAANMIKHAVSL